MAYTDFDFKTKKSLREAVAGGTKVHCYQPGPIALLRVPGTVYLEGPHYPKPHTWYAQVQCDAEGYITKFIG